MRHPIEQLRELQAEVERLTFERDKYKAEAHLLTTERDAFEGSYNAAVARVEELEGVVSKWQEVGRSTLDQLEHEGDSVIFIPKSHEDTMRRLLAATEQGESE